MSPTEQELKEIEHKKKRVELGEQALTVETSGHWEWVCTNILDAMEERAMNKLHNAKTDLDRLQAQQMLLASRDPRFVFREIINQARGAAEELSQISTLGG